ncbi:heme NO-binding domain-containing protein [Tabrizicola sp.]|uniref:heme NO-binding domain-containing protein n=1 Tax=Tabrizicola sp. TaxID=2005166 RepID=UPI002869F1D6|nr:heme NO-binding domain-containing protein [Tabrizicola sp.]
MQGLVLRSLQGYLRDTFGPSAWADIVREAALPVESFEPMLRYPSGLADTLAATAAQRLGRPAEELWEDLGTYLVTNPNYESLRRLLRFGGVGFSDFLHSLEELPGRARLALPDLDVPDLALEELGQDRFRLTCRSHVRGASRVLIGVLMAMADDYGALIVIDQVTEQSDQGVIMIHMPDASHASGRRFDLARPVA